MSPSYAESDPRTTTPVGDLSRTGALVVATPLLPLGSHIELRFVAFPDDPVPFVHTGRVIRHLSEPAGMGVEFDPLPPVVMAQLDAIIERARTSRRRRRGKRMVLDGALDAHELRVRLLSK